MPATRRRPPQIRVLDEPAAERRATWLELFFDLVYVVAIAELAGVLHDDPDWGGALRFAGLSVPVIWTWMNFIFYADQFDTDDVPYRLTVFAAMLGAAALAVSLPDAGTAFVLAYVVLKALLAGLYERARRAGTDRLAREFAGWCTVAYAASGVLWLASLAVDAPLRQLLWAAGLAVEIGMPIFGPRVFAEMPFSPAHIPERYGLFTLIVFGESIVVTALGVADGGFHTSAAFTAVACFVLACALWWLYFDRIEDNVLGGAIRPNLLFIYGHPPLFAALTAVSVGAGLAIEHASGEALALGDRAILAGGTAVTLALMTLVQAATLRPPPRAALVRRGAGIALALVAIAVLLPALAICAALALVMAALAVLS